MIIIVNVHDGHRGLIGAWLAEPLDLAKLQRNDIVIYRDHSRAEVGIVTSWNERVVWARYSIGDTAAAASPSDLMLGVRSLDTIEEFFAATAELNKPDDPQGSE